MSGTKQRVALSPCVLTPFVGKVSSIWTFYNFCVFFALFIHIPTFMLASKDESFWLFFAWFSAVEGARFISFVVFAYWWRVPTSMSVLIDFSISTRMFLPATMLCFAYSDAPLLVHLMIIALWVGLEVWAMRAGNRVPVKQAFTLLKRQSMLIHQDDGTWLYKTGGVMNLSELLDRHSPLGVFMGKSNKYGMPLVFIFPSFFLLSEGAGDNFDFRLFLAGCICLWLGYFTMPVLASSRVTRRTLRALERGEIG